MTSIGMKAFRDCQNLKRIKIPNGVTSISDRMFQWCGNLRSIYFLTFYERQKEIMKTKILVDYFQGMPLAVHAYAGS